jgi:hypothetical protein
MDTEKYSKMGSGQFELWAFSRAKNGGMPATVTKSRRFFEAFTGRTGGCGLEDIIVPQPT